MAVSTHMAVNTSGENIKDGFLPDIFLLLTLTILLGSNNAAISTKAHAEIFVQRKI